LEEVIALVLRGNPLKFHRLVAGHTGHERYEWALVIIHRASNRLQNRSFLPSCSRCSRGKNRRAGSAASLFTLTLVDDAATQLSASLVLGAISTGIGRSVRSHRRGATAASSQLLSEIAAFRLQGVCAPFLETVRRPPSPLPLRDVIFGNLPWVAIGDKAPGQKLGPFPRQSGRHLLSVTRGSALLPSPF
jgi:hypothetical protein